MTPEQQKAQNEEVRVKFNAAWPKIMSELITDNAFSDITRIVDWLKYVMEENVPCGKQFRGLAVVHVYRFLVPERNPQNDFLSYVLGWMAEIGQAAALIADDVMDESETRRGKPCWYKLHDVQMSAVNDAFMLENIGYHILLKYFSDKEYFLQLYRMAMQSNLKTIFGQSLDTKLGMAVNLDEFTQETYESVVKYKTSYYTFYGPAAVAMILAGITEQVLFDAVEDLTLKIGYLFQVQDDFLDCYGNPSITGKIGTDIRDGKCSWLIVKALELASHEQRDELNEFYGSKNIHHEERIKRIYGDLDLVGTYRRHEQDTYTEILKLIQSLPSELPQEPFRATLSTIYKRNK